MRTDILEFGTDQKVNVIQIEYNWLSLQLKNNANNMQST